MKGKPQGPAEWNLGSQRSAEQFLGRVWVVAGQFGRGWEKYAKRDFQLRNAKHCVPCVLFEVNAMKLICGFLEHKLQRRYHDEKSTPSREVLLA